MALVFKDGKYYQSNNGVLKEYSPTSLAGDYYSGAISQNDFNLVQNSVNPKSTNLAANSYSVPTSVPTNQNNAFNEFTQFAATAPSNIAQSGSVASVPQTRVPTYEEYVAQQNLPKGTNLAANPFAVPASTPATLTPAEQQFLDFTALAGAMPETVIPTTNTGVTNYTPAGTNESTGFDLQSILDLLTGIGNTPAQGTNEDYNVTTSQSELGQALQDEALRGLNGQFGYTADEQAAIYKNAIDQFNATQEADLLKLQNLYEQYGISNPTGMGGQGGSSLQDYYGKRALAQEDLTTNLAQQFSDKATQEKQYAIQNAMGINSQLYEQQRGDFADMLSLMGFNADMDAQTFNQQLQLMGFESDQAQQQFLNQQGISDREIANYFQTLNTENSMNQWWTEYLQSTQVDPNTIAQLLGNSESDIAQLLTQGANNYQNTESPYSSLAMMLGLLTNQGNNSGTNNTGTSDALSGLGDLLSNINPSNLGSIDWTKLLNGSVDLSNPLSWPADLVSGLGSAGASVTLGGKTYTVGANGLLTNAATAGNANAANTVGSEYTKTAGSTAAAGAVSLASIAAATALIGGATAIGVNWYKQTKEQGEDRRAYSEKFDNVDALIEQYKDHNFGNFETDVGGITKYGLDAVTSIISDTNKLNAWVDEQPVINQATSNIRQAELKKIQNLSGMNAFLNNMDTYYGMFDSQTNYDGISAEDIGLVGLLTPEFQTMYSALKEKYGDTSYMKSYFKETDTKMLKMYNKLNSYQFNKATAGGTV
jgi:hypothetical protein